MLNVNSTKKMIIAEEFRRIAANRLQCSGFDENRLRIVLNRQSSGNGHLQYYYRIDAIIFEQK